MMIEIVAHFYHHRGQIHILLVEHNKYPKISLFECFFIRIMKPIKQN